MIVEKSDRFRRKDIMKTELLPATNQAFLNDFSKLMQCYHGALKVASTQLEILDAEIRSSNDHQPIHYMESRIKSPKSLFDKMRKKGFDITMSNVQRITDIAGIRVVCSYTQDIYYLYDLIQRSECFKIVRERDYIKKPKPNGYRSLHIVVIVPVHLSEGMLELPVEIQIRSIAMDLWASLEHELRYKSDRVFSEEDEKTLLDCAEKLALVDAQMQELFLRDDKENGTEA